MHFRIKFLLFNDFLSYYGCHMPFEILIAISKRRDLFEVIAINGMVILKCILKE